jgi:hypothetical protein
MSRQEKKRKRKINDLSTVDLGDVCELQDCCREVRLGSRPCQKDQILSGYNTLADRYEEFLVIRTDKNHWQSLVRRIK